MQEEVEQQKRLQPQNSREGQRNQQDLSGTTVLELIMCPTSVEDRLTLRSRVCACVDSLRPAKPWNRVYSGLSWLNLTVCGPARVRFCRRSIKLASSSISAGLLCLPPVWISSSLCINSAKFSMTSSKAGWLAEMIGSSQGRKLVKSEQFQSIPWRRVSIAPPLSICPKSLRARSWLQLTFINC
jgi:hypothetical protein